MSVDKWAYDAAICDPAICPGDCDLCDIAKNPEKYGIEEDDEEQEIINARRGEE